jgi:lactoylglutathione lyase
MPTGIEHIAIWARDLELLREYYTSFIGGTAGSRYLNQRTGFASYFVTFDSGARLELMSRPSVNATRDEASHVGYAHLAFSVGSAEGVDALTERIRAAGYTVVSEPRTTGDGYYESVVLDPEGNVIEITI